MTEKWHNLPWQKVIEILESNLEKGLSEKEVRTRQKIFGKNKLPEEKPLSWVKILLEQFQSPLVYILVIAGFICSLLREWADVIVIWSAVFLDVIVGFLQENKASNILRELKKVLKLKAIVLREGGIKEVLQEDLVPGDIVILKPGERVPADGRLIEAYNLKINEAPLTGEWLPAEKHSKILPKTIPLADRENMVYMGTVVEGGSGKAVITKIGTKTEIGKVAKMIKEVREGRTPFQKKLANFSRTVAILIGIICLAIFIEGIIANRQPFEMFTIAVAVAVAAIPEGLPVAMTVILALGTQRILKKKGLVRRLASVETLGSTSIIATDKTLTLTEGKMEISEIFSKKEELALKIGALCNEAFIENPEKHFLKWKVCGNPTDKALVLGAAKAGFLKPKLERELPKIDEIPFDTKYKFIATLHRGKNENFLYISGAPERIIELSFKVEKETEKENLNVKTKRKLYEKLEELTARGKRVIAVAFKILPKTEKKLPSQEKISDLVFVGFIALRDPLRRGAKKAIKACKKAGMKPIIVTGDHLLTAKAVAQELGLKTGKENIILGQDLDKLSDKEFQKRLKDITVYARVEPRHKLRIIEAWQERGEVVAMTGDGINDAPALKKADVGVALGSGTEVAKEASDLVLLTDDFSTIVKAIKEGRAILDNIRKVTTYLICDSFTEVVLVGASIIAKVPLPVTAIQILWVNLIEDGLPDIALAFEPKERDLMERKPEPHKIPLLTKEMKALTFVAGIIDDLILLSFFLWLLRQRCDINFIRTMIFANLSIDTFYVAFSCKSLRRNLWQINLFSNKFLVGAIILGILMLIFAIYFPPFQVLLKTVPLGINDWLIVILFGTIDLGLIEATKWYFIKRKIL